MWDYKIGETLSEIRERERGQSNQGEIYGRDMYERMKSENGR